MLIILESCKQMKTYLLHLSRGARKRSPKIEFGENRHYHHLPIDEGEFLEADKAIREMTEGKFTRMSEEDHHLDVYLGKGSSKPQPNTKLK